MPSARFVIGVLAAVGAWSASGCKAQAPENKDAGANIFASMKLRSIGPAYSSGRISDFAFFPGSDHDYLVATASGGVWRTRDNGTTWKPVFDDQGSYATGVIEIDPGNPDVVWLGTGENNAQRSVANGDGVYKSLDGGETWTNMGLEDSGHIGQIIIDPTDPDIVYVAAIGPLWSDGGDRGFYKTTDGGETWTRVLDLDERTGANEAVMHAERPGEIVVSTWRRRRHVWTLINGGPGSGLHKTTDGGRTWRALSNGLPSAELGRIGLAAAPSDPDVVYAIVESEDEGARGVYRSDDFGESWTKKSGRATTSAQYYNELIVSPQDPNVVYSLDTFSAVSRDGGVTWSPIGGNQHRHVDDHALRIDPDDPDHMHIGGDGGVYESYDGGQNWRHVKNLPLLQFYRLTPDNDLPFYNVCGGTQDNNSLCGPSRTPRKHGVANWDWKIILGGDGYKAVFDPNDPNIIYTQYQYGGLARYDRRTQERLYIAPQPEAGEPDYKWNWNTPIIVSPHDPERIYYAAEYLFRSDDRGDSWRKVSPDLSRGIDRNALEVMGRVWSVDAVAKNDSTSFYGSAIALAESPLQEGLIYVGTDDGLIQVTEDGGESWRKVERFRGVPDMSLVEDIIASVHDADIAYAVIDNHKRGDFKPYVLKTIDRGRSWRRIDEGLPERGSAHTIAEDHVDPDLLFVGTEYGLFVTQTGGGAWTRLKNGLPTIAVRDLEIQRRENDLVVATFGRGAYILDDYSPMRTKAGVLTSEATLFEPRDGYLYVEGDYWGVYGRYGARGADFWVADNPPYGVVVRYHLKDGYKTRKDKRREAEKERARTGADNPYPSWDDLREEDREDAPAVLLEFADADGAVVRRIEGPSAKGLHQVAWDMRAPAPDPVDLTPDPPGLFGGGALGPLVAPGEYRVRLLKRVDGRYEPLGEPQSFTLKSMDRTPEEATGEAREELVAFQARTSELMRQVQGAAARLGEIDERIEHLQAGLQATPAADLALAERARTLEARADDLRVSVLGDQTIASRNEPTPISIAERVGRMRFMSWNALAPVSENHRASVDVGAAEFADALQALKALDGDVLALEREAEALGVAWTPGRPLGDGTRP